MSGADEAKVTSFEERVADQRIEHGLAYDGTGNAIWEGSGKADSINVPNRVDLEGMGFSHNHPQGGSFSAVDLGILFEKRMGEIRVATSHGTFSMRRKAGARLARIESRITEIMPDITASLRAIEPEAPFDDNRADDLLWRVLASEGLLDYDYTPRTMRPQNPISEALSTRRPGRKRETSTTLRTPSNQEYRDFMDGKAPYPGMEGFFQILRKLAIEEGETGS